jgi:hypothetical protein
MPGARRMRQRKRNSPHRTTFSRMPGAMRKLWRKWTGVVSPVHRSAPGHGGSCASSACELQLSLEVEFEVSSLAARTTEGTSSAHRCGRRRRVRLGCGVGQGLGCALPASEWRHDDYLLTRTVRLLHCPLQMSIIRQPSCANTVQLDAEHRAHLLGPISFSCVLRRSHGQISFRPQASGR